MIAVPERRVYRDERGRIVRAVTVCPACRKEFQPVLQGRKASAVYCWLRCRTRAAYERQGAGQ